MSKPQRGDEPEPEPSEEPEPEQITRERVAGLLADRRRNLPRDRHVEDHTHIDSNGDKIRRVEWEKQNGEVETIDANLTQLLGAAPSTTSNREVLRIEAQQAAEADEQELARMNPHIPSNDGVLAAAVEAIERDGLTPAWEVVDGDSDDRTEVFSQ